MIKISREFKASLKLDPRPAYEIAHLANVDPYWLSKAINGAVAITQEDQRLYRVAEILGLPETNIFEIQKAHTGNK